MTSVVDFLRRRSWGGGGTTARRCSKSRRSLMSMRYRGRPESRVARFMARSSPVRIQVRTLSMLTPHWRATSGGVRFVLSGDNHAHLRFPPRSLSHHTCPQSALVVSIFVGKSLIFFMYWMRTDCRYIENNRNNRLYRQRRTFRKPLPSLWGTGAVEGARGLCSKHDYGWRCAPHQS